MLGHEFWQGVLQGRKRLWSRQGKRLCPVDRCPEYMIPPATPVGVDLERVAEIERRLCGMDPSFRLIYDPLTASNGGPGYHLYNVTPNGFPGGYGKLVLEMSCQVDPHKPWPHGIPKWPDSAFVNFVGQCLKKDLEKHVRLDRLRRAEKSLEMQQKEDEELKRFYYSEVFEPHYVSGRTQVGYGPGRGRRFG